MTDLYAKTAQQMLDPATITSLSSAPVRKLAERIAIAVAGDEQLGGGCDLSAGMFGTRLSALVVELAGQEAELYAAQDQVEGLQELMRANTVPALLDTAVRYLVGAADSQSDNATTGSPHHGHRIAGRWDGDGTNRKGALCEECAAWNIMRKYAATDIVAEAQVIEDARVTQLLATLKRADGIISMLMPGSAKVFNLDIMELNEGMMEITQALAIKKGAAQ